MLVEWFKLAEIYFLV